MTGDFTCECCGGTFQRAWTEVEAEAERERLWGSPAEPDDIEVCDLCFKRLLGKLRIRLLVIEEPD